MGGINIEAGDVAGSTKFDYAPRGFFFPPNIAFVGDVLPVIGRVMPPAFPSTVECAVWSELTFQVWCWLS